MNRRVLAAVGLLSLLALGGCLGSTEIPEEDLTGNATYDWDTDATVQFNLSRSSYTTVLSVSDQPNITVFTRDALGSDTPVRLASLQFRYTNGTVVNVTDANLSASLSQSETVITVPARNGTVGFTASRSGKQFASPAFTGGSYELILPPGARVGLPLLSQTSPGDYRTTVENNRMRIRWDNVTSGSINVRYYLERDLLLFGGLVGIVVVVGAGGTIYYLRQIRALESKREEIGVNVDSDDLDDREPPPGM